MNADAYSNLDRRIVLSQYDKDWPLLYSQEKDRILREVVSLSDHFVDIAHIGSTSIPGLISKPTIDIAIAIQDFKYVDGLILLLKELNYVYVPELMQELPNRRFFWAGTRDVHTFHVHAVEHGKEDWCDLIMFRDFVKSSPVHARQYCEAKLKSANNCNSSIKKYVDGKYHAYKEILEIATGQKSLE